MLLPEMIMLTCFPSSMRVRSMDIYSFVSTVFIMGRISHYRIISSLVRYLCRVKAASGFMLQRIGADACLSGQNLQIVECFAGELWIPPVDCNLRAESFEMLHGCLGTDGVIRCLFDEYNGLQRAAFIVTDTAGTAYRPSRYLVVAVWKWTEQGTVAH